MKQTKTARIDAYCTSGPSPTTAPKLRLVPPTVHLLGAGSVGCCLLDLLVDTPYRLVAVTDSSGTVYDKNGLDPARIAAFKRRGGRLADHPKGRAVTTPLAVEIIDTDAVVDATPTDFSTRGIDAAHAAVARGAVVIAAAKDTVCRLGTNIGANAALGGAGHRLREELTELEARCRAVALAGNASTTTILQAIESGASFDEGVKAAQDAGYLEPNPEQDFCGTDAAVKLAAVHALLFGQPIDPASIACEDIRDVDIDEVRTRAARGFTTRLVARADDDGVRVSYEALPVTSPLATPCDRVAYCYELDDGNVRVHTGGGVGHGPTAASLFYDLTSLVPTGIDPTIASSSFTVTPSDGVFFAGSTPVTFRLDGPADAPVVVVQGGISAGRDCSTWWPEIVGENLAIDPKKVRVLTLDYVPGSTDEQAHALAALLDHLDIDRVRAFVGSSYGGMVGLVFAACYADRLEHLVAISAPDRPHPLATAWRSLQRQIVRFGQDNGDTERGLALARALAMTTYRSAAELEERFGADPFEVEQYLDHCGASFVKRFEADKLVALSEAIDRHRVDPAEVRVPTTLVAVTSDVLVPLWQLERLAEQIAAPCELVAIDSLYGHDAFLKETDQVTQILEGVLS